jgi:hypothetical protein
LQKRYHEQKIGYLLTDESLAPHRSHQFDWSYEKIDYPCFDGSVLVLLSDGTNWKPFDSLMIGDTLASPVIPTGDDQSSSQQSQQCVLASTTIKHIYHSPVHHQYDMVYYNDMWITPGQSLACIVLLLHMLLSHSLHHLVIHTYI